MDICAVICEFNPFHNGHKYLLDMARSQGATHIVAIMSGNFLQRGDVAILSKWARTKQALLNGADLVVELPTVKAIASAEDFASGGIQIANALGCVNTLAFGSECGSASKITELAKILSSDYFIQNVAKHMQNGKSYASTVEYVVKNYYSPQLAKILQSPNNTLAVEYVKAIINQNSNIKPITITRTGVMHDSKTTENEFASASFLRKQIYEQSKDFSAFMPESSYNIFTKEVSESKAPCFLENIEQSIIYKLRSMTKEQLKALPYVTEGLENRIFTAVKSNNSISDILEAVKTKRYTYARLCRIIICAFLEINKAIQKQPVEYIRVLGFNKNGTEILKLAKEYATAPVIGKITDSYNKLSPTAKAMLDIDIKASDLYAMCQPHMQKCGLDYTNGLIVM